jgi:hypothetical protein
LENFLHISPNRPNGHSLRGAVLLVQNINDPQKITLRFGATMGSNFRPQSYWILIASAIAIDGEQRLVCKYFPCRVWRYPDMSLAFGLPLDLFPSDSQSRFHVQETSFKKLIVVVTFDQVWKSFAHHRVIKKSLRIA